MIECVKNTLENIEGAFMNDYQQYGPDRCRIAMYKSK